MLKTLLSTLLIMASPVHADILGLADGLIVDDKLFRELTLDVNARAQSDTKRVGIRAVLPRYANHYALFIETSNVEGEWDDLAINGDAAFDGSNTGGGLYIGGFSLLENFHTTFKLAYHVEENNIDSLVTIGGRVPNVDEERSSWTATVLLSPLTPLMENGLRGYGALGIAATQSSRRVYVDEIEETTLAQVDDSFKPYLAAGVVLPLNRIRVYAVAELQEQFSLTLGLRWHVTRLVE